MKGSKPMYRKLLVKWLHFKLSLCPNAAIERDRRKMITQAKHYNRMIAEQGHGTHRSIVLQGRRY